jgi:hypothetical protein
LPRPREGDSLPASELTPGAAATARSPPVLEALDPCCCAWQCLCTRRAWRAAGQGKLGAKGACAARQGSELAAGQRSCGDVLKAWLRAQSKLTLQASRPGAAESGREAPGPARGAASTHAPRSLRGRRARSLKNALSPRATFLPSTFCSAEPRGRSGVARGVALLRSTRHVAAERANSAKFWGQSGA